MYFILICSLVICSMIIIGVRKSITWYNNNNNKNTQHGEYKEIPIVYGGLPFVGHGISFGADIIGFIRRSCNEYGKIFKIKLFRKYLIVVCDRKLIKEYFHSTEESMSLNDALSNLYFDEGFVDNKLLMGSMISLIKKSIMVRFDVFAAKIMDEAKNMCEQIKSELNINGNNKPIELLDIITRFVAHTSARCFIGIKLSKEFYHYLLKFKDLLDKIVILTYFLPKPLIKIIIGPFLRRYRRKMTDLLIDEIQKYRIDMTKNDSIIIRKCVDHYDDIIKRGFTNTEIGDIIICLLYVSTENTALGLSSAIIDLASNDIYWDKVKNESNMLLQSNNLKKMFSSKLLNLCIHESARLNTHIFAINRIPKKKQFLGKYYIGIDNYSQSNAYCVAICEPFLMKFKYADEIYSNPLQYNPDRFTKTDNQQSKKSYDLMTWGAGEHLCPGKTFAIYEMIAAMITITTSFKKLEINKKDLEKIDYFSPSAFAKRNAKVIFQSI